MLTGFHKAIHIVDDCLWQLGLAVFDCYCETLPGEGPDRGVDEGVGDDAMFDVDVWSRLGCRVCIGG
jgi:hypothetical protein